ncbi:MAG: PilN domain-containing protein [Burkholderiaceae bacterium]|nr:PilN domain-containing protein [Burkholderiaceae bacterium]
MSRVQNINLYPQARARRRPFSRAGAIAIAAALTLGVGVLHALQAQRAKSLRATVEATERSAQHLERQLAAAPAAARQAEESLAALEAEVATLEASAARFGDGALARAGGFTAALRALASGQTPGVWLTGIRIDHQGPQLVLEGKALHAARVPAFIAHLEKLPAFAGTSFATLELKPAEEAGATAPATAVRFRLASATPEKAGQR